MDYMVIIVIAVGLAMDAFAVSIVNGASYRHSRLNHALRMAIFFGAFQAFMPLIGILLTLSIKRYIVACDHWIAFALLSAIGAKMIYESFKIKSAKKKSNIISNSVLLALAVATSIDAFAVGITLPLITESIAVAVITIGIVTFILSYVGVYIGKQTGHFFESKIEAFGGLVLIGLGIKILIEHLLF
jgi:putative Mn2+ efflux pump MntP